MPFVQPRHGGKTQSLRGAGIEYASVTTGALNTKGSWVELSASLGVAARALDVVFLGAPSGIWYLMDVGVGAAGSEQVIAPNLQMQTFSDFGAESRTFHRIPYPLKAGVRIAMRGQASSASQIARVAVIAHAGQAQDSHQGVQRITSYGHNLANSQGTLIDPGGVANTKGAWVQLSASLTYPVRRLAFAVVPPSAVIFCAWTLDLGVGAAGSEQVVVPDVPFHGADIGKGVGPNAPSFEVSIPAGVRLAVRAQCDSASSPGRNLHTVAYAFG